MAFISLLARLLLLFVKLFCKLLDLPTLTRVVAHEVMHRVSGTTVIAAECLMRALVTSWASAPTRHHSYSCGSAFYCRMPSSSYSCSCCCCRCLE
jgi:hypothetical protein